MTLTANQLSQLYRRQQVFLNKATVRAVTKVWPAFKWDDLDGSFPELAAAVAAVVRRNRKNSAGLAAAYLRAHRAASGLDGDVRIVVPEFLPAEQFITSLRVTSLVAAKKSAAALVPAETAMSNALAQASGSMSKLVLDGGRQTVLGTLANDPKAAGWLRATSGGCDFCELLASRGAVYSFDSADFAAHDHCSCVVIPDYGNEFRGVKDYVASDRFKTQSARDANNSRIRRDLANRAN